MVMEDCEDSAKGPETRARRGPPASIRRGRGTAMEEVEVVEGGFVVGGFPVRWKVIRFGGLLRRRVLWDCKRQCEGRRTLW